MIEFIQPGILTITCDECGFDADIEAEDDGRTNLKIGIERAKEEGWVVKRDETQKGGFLHLCPDCGVGK